VPGPVALGCGGPGLDGLGFSGPGMGWPWRCVRLAVGWPWLV
jgi:hypothetical protein